MKSVKATIERTDVEELLKILGEKSPVGICVIQDGKFCYVNPSFPIVTGYTADELEGMDSLEIVVPEDREMVRENAIKMLKGKLLSPCQFRVICKDGSIKWLMETVRSIRYRGRRATLGNYMEITERKQAEEALEESEERYRELANSITDVFFAMDEHLRYTYWNRASEILTGIRAEEALGKSLREIFPDVPWVRKAEKVYRKVLRTQQSQTFVSDTDIGGRHQTFEISAYPSRDGISVFVRDITGRKQMEDAVRQSEEKYRVLSEEAPVGVCVMQDGKFCYFNSNFPLAIGYTADELIGKDPLELIVPEDREIVRENEIKMLKGELIPPYQFRVIHKDGSIRWVMEAVRSVQYRGRRAVLGNYMEVTERKQMEDRLEESERKYRLLFETSLDCIAQLDREGRYLAANPAVAKSLGVPLEELIGKTVFEVMTQEVAQLRLGNVRKVLDEWQPQIFEDERAGRYFHHIVIPTKTSEQKEAVQVFTRDITERKQAEEKLRQSEENYKTLFNSSVIGMYVLDIETMKVVMGNQASAEIAGFSSAEEGIGINPFDFVVPEEREKVLEIAINEFLQDSRRTHEIQVMDKNGRRGWHSISIARIMHKGRPASLVSFTDITERKQAEEALRQSEEKYRALFDSLVIGTIVLDAETLKVTMVNQAAAKIFGLSSAEEASGLSIFDFIFPDDREKAIKLTMKDMFEQDLRQPNEIRVMTKDGRTIWISATGARIMHEGRLAGLISFTDITERRKMEEALRQGEEKYRALFNSAVIGMVVLDAETMKIAMVNQAALNMFGFSSVDEAIALNPLEFIVLKDRERALENAMKGTFEQDLRQTYEFRAVTKDGREIWISTTGTKIMHEGRVAGLISLADITERKQMEEKLRQSRERYRALFDSSVIGTLVVDAETMKVVMGNQAAVKMFGFSSAKEGAGVNPLDFVPSEDREKNLERIVKGVFEKDSRKSVDLKAVTSDGREIWVSATGARITHKGRLAGLISFTDITERKQAEEALRRSEERYRTILEEMEDAYFEVDLGGHLTFANNSVCRDLGYSREELIGMSYKGFTIEDDIESVFRVFNEVYQTGVPNKGFPWKTIRKDGVQGFAETSVSPLRNNKGEIVGFRGVGRDITERRKVMEALRQSEENYRALFDSSVTGAFVIDAETMKVVIANQAASTLFGFSSVEEAIGVDPLDFIPPDDKEGVLKLIMKDLLERDTRQAYDVRAITKDGREIWISATGAKTMHAGKLGGLISFTDITERKRAEEALRLSEENYRALFDSSVIGTFVLNAETMKVVMGNQAAADMFGFGSVEEAIGINPFDYVPPEDREKYLEIAMTELFEQDLRTTHEFRAITKDGKKMWISITGARIMHEGKLGGLICFTDITDRKQAEEALRQSEENYRVLFDNSVIGTIVLDAETLKVAMVNQAAAKMFGFSSAEEASGIDPLVFIRPDDRERILDIALKALFEEDSRAVYELGAVTKDGREIWINATGARVMRKGKLAGLICFTDITEQKRQRERLMMTDRLASLGELASGTAHELNNPLTSIVGFSQLLIEKEVPDDIREDLKLINNEAQRAAKVTKNLLTFARKHAPMKQRIQINSVIEDVLKLRAHEHKTNGIEVEKQLAPDLPEIMVDYFQMQQVLINIVINAEYFMTEAHNRGTLTVTTKKQNNTVVISFADDGPGIPPENMRRIFDPFFTTKEAGKGTGLGLSICHGIVAEHGGQIYAKSQPGKGTTIFVELPINER